MLKKGKGMSTGKREKVNFSHILPDLKVIGVNGRTTIDFQKCWIPKVKHFNKNSAAIRSIETIARTGFNSVGDIEKAIQKHQNCTIENFTL